MSATPNYSAEQIKDAVNKLTKGRFKQFGSIVDIAGFIWDVVNDMIDNFNDKNLTLQQKEDVAVGISRCVVSELESKNLISKELSDKMLNIINSADGVLDVLLSVYTTVTTKNLVDVVCGFFGFKCCSKNTQKTEVPKSLKIEVIDGEVKVKEVETPKELCSKEQISPELCSKEQISPELCSKEQISPELCSKEQISPELCSKEDIENKPDNEIPPLEIALE
jgi:hypothetical protein